MTIESSKVSFLLPITGETPTTNGTVSFQNVDDISRGTNVIVKVGAVEESKNLASLSLTETVQLERSFARLGFDYRALFTSDEAGEGFLLREVAVRMGNETADTAEGKKRLERIFYGGDKDFGRGERRSLTLMAARTRLGESLEALMALARVKPRERANAIRHVAEAAASPGGAFGKFRDFTDPLMTSACSFLAREVFYAPMSAYETAMKALPLVCPSDVLYEIVTDRLPTACQNGHLDHLVPNTAIPDHGSSGPVNQKSPRAPAPLEPVKEPERPEVTEERNIQECEKPWLRRIAVRSLGVILKRPAETVLGFAEAEARYQTTTKLVELLLNDPDSSVRMAAAFALSMAENDDLRQFAGKFPDQVKAVERLSQLAGELQNKLAGVPERIRRMAAQSNLTAKQETQDALAWKAYPTVTDMEGEKDPHRLATLVQRFGEGIFLLNGKSRVPIIVAFLSHPATEVSLAAAHVLGHLPDEFWIGFEASVPNGVTAIEKTIKALSDYAYNCRVIFFAMGETRPETTPPGK